MDSTAMREVDAASERTLRSPDFAGILHDRGLGSLARDRVTTLQVNLGKRCNMACHHCHVEAGPSRTEVMAPPVATRVIEVLAANPDVETLDLTGGAPELDSSFRRLVLEARRLGRRVVDRCNLTILLEPGMDDLAQFLAANQVEVVASLPCYGPENVEKQRGDGAFDKSVAALRRLNELGYGRPGSPLRLHLVYNPVGAFLPPAQGPLAGRYREALGSEFGIEFHDLLTIANMPLGRFGIGLARGGGHQAYVNLLVDRFNPATVHGLMCRSLVSVGWDGRLWDCDFNQMREIEIGAAAETGVRTVWDVGALADLAGRSVATAEHCFGCTAGAGSGCSGAIG